MAALPGWLNVAVWGVVTKGRAVRREERRWALSEGLEFARGAGRGRDEPRDVSAIC